MSKELTPLKALKELKKKYGKNFSLNDDERCRTIKSALEELDFFVRQYRYLQELLVKVNRDKEKYRQALEIIKQYIHIEENGEDDLFPYHVRDVQYVSNRSCRIMSEEDYEVLKEVLK